MLILKGKYNQALIMIDHIDEATTSQLYSLLNHPAFAKSHIAVMADTQSGEGSVVGFTMKINGYIIPNIVGVDVGCAVNAYNLGKMTIDLVALDNFVHENIPHGYNVNKDACDYERLPFRLQTDIARICENTVQDYGKVKRGIGSLGGGNHFIEVDLDPDGNCWLLVHTGSRNFGLRVCKYHQRKAEELIRKMFLGASAYKGLEYLPLEMGGYDYLADAYIAQDYAHYNREAIADRILSFLAVKPVDTIESIHNYINIHDDIIRKGAISANLGERVVIPFNSLQGVAIATGKGSKKWNYSAPHGAGRIMSRTVAKATLNANEYQKDMIDAGIYTTTANESTIDECWKAYKNKEDIVSAIAETVDINFFMKPIWNFKSGTKTEV
jgi:RNA-splicing ligase RtcB